MIWTTVENYRQLETAYEQKRAEYQEAEAAYREALNEPTEPGVVVERYRRLEALHDELDRLFQQLQEDRSTLAAARDNALSLAL
jgi:DNA repair exonuclease SbcCD ATPase subunit